MNAAQPRPRRVLILCTGNSCRSQMAEALWRRLAHGRWEVFSAGTRPAGFVHPLAITVLGEMGIDAAAARSKPVSELGGRTFDLVVTVCGQAEAECPVYPSAVERLHWPFDDPAAAGGSPDEQLKTFRWVRDEIAARIRGYLAAGDCA